MPTGFRHGVYLDADHGVQVQLLRSSSNGNARREESHVPYEGEADCKTWNIREHSPINGSSEVETASVVWWSEVLATDPEVHVRFPAIPDFLSTTNYALLVIISSRGMSELIITSRA
jgi:hypothetical protein